jgi:hypothetical protein
MSAGRQADQDAGPSASSANGFHAPGRKGDGNMLIHSSIAYQGDSAVVAVLHGRVLNGLRLRQGEDAGRWPNAVSAERLPSPAPHAHSRSGRLPMRGCDWRFAGGVLPPSGVGRPAGSSARDGAQAPQTSTKRAVGKGDRFPRKIYQNLMAAGIASNKRMEGSSHSETKAHTAFYMR